MIYRIALLIFMFLGFIQQTIAQREFEIQEGDTSYVMKRYVFMLLNEGPNRSQDSATVAEIQKGHMNHLNKMAETGKMFLAGPFDSGGKYRGILIFDVDSIAQAVRMESTDPAILSGRLEMETMFWWAAKGTKLP